MVRHEIINELIKRHKYKKYLEIGVESGLCLTRVNVKDKTSVDPKPVCDVSHKMTSDEFFEHNKQMFDIIFIDGLHHSDQVDRDIRNSLRFLSPNGAIVLHDCNPANEIVQRVPRQSSEWNGDVWKSIVRFINSSHGDYEVFTVNSDQGCAVIRRGHCECNFVMPKNLHYEWFDENRTQCLNLITVKQFMDIA